MIETKNRKLTANKLTDIRHICKVHYYNLEILQLDLIGKLSVWHFT